MTTSVPFGIAVVGLGNAAKPHARALADLQRTGKAAVSGVYARDVEQGLGVTLDHFRTRAQQERALEVLQFKLDILWAMNDAMATAYGVSS